MMKERTIEITDYCPSECDYCSSEASEEGNNFLSLVDLVKFLPDDDYDRINISGGEPLAHHNFYEILQFCKSRIKKNGIVVVYTNALENIMFNANVISGIRVEANLVTRENTGKVHILKMVNQGREKDKPDIHYSCNWDDANCDKCNNLTLRSSGKIAPAPCKKYADNERE